MEDDDDEEEEEVVHPPPMNFADMEFEDDDGGMGGMGMAGMGGMGDMGEDDMPQLPEGVIKEVVTPATSSTWKRPKEGDEVTIHSVGTFMEDGKSFRNTREQGKPLTFTVGQGDLCHGLEVGVTTMAKGEVAKFTIWPEQGYGEASSAALGIPPKTTIVEEVELLSWIPKDDLFEDKGVIKAAVKEGLGWKEPREGEEVLFSFKALTKSGELIEEKQSLEYIMGSDSLGALSRTLDKALSNMKRKEEAELVCTKEYAYGDAHPDGAIVKVTLEELYETRDVFWRKDGTVTKKQVREGEGYDNPKDNTPVTLKVVAATDGSAPLPGFTPTTLEFVAGDGDVCEALECAVREMKRGERAVVTSSDPTLCQDSRLGLSSTAAKKVCLTVELEDFKKREDTWKMEEDQKVAYGQGRKEIGATLFKKGRYHLALEKYKKVVDMFGHLDDFNEENKAKAKEMKKVCELNRAACYLKLREFAEAKESCNEILKDEPRNVKGLFRRAQAEIGLKNFFEAIGDLKKVIDLEPQNREARAALKEAQALQKEEDQKSKGLFGKMCQALGKGGGPEPSKENGAEAETEGVMPPESES